jgi:hypothetical protein
MFAFACNSVFSQNVLTSKEKVHQNELNKALKAAGFASSVSNNSVFFKKDNVTYWITLRCPNSISDVEFTINRGGYKLGADNYNRNFAMLACNEVNKKFPLVKIYCEESRVAVCIQTCAKDGKELAALMNSYLNAFDGVKDCFEEEYGKIAGTDESKETHTEVAVVEVATPVAEIASTPVAVESGDAVQADVVEKSELTISASSARGISAAGVAGEFGGPIQGFKTDFTRSRRAMSSNTGGMRTIGCPSKRFARLYLKPENWEPAMGCPPTKVKPYFSASGKQRLQISRLTPQQSRTSAECEIRWAFSSNHAALPPG